MIRVRMHLDPIVHGHRRHPVQLDRLIFTDPPYADKVQYGELNFVWEAWLGFDTRWHDEEIIVNASGQVRRGLGGLMKGRWPSASGFSNPAAG